MMEVTDRRIARTHKMLLQAMITLLGKYEWNDINVLQICEEADIARSTFYSHFENKQELYDFGFAKLEAHIKDAVAQKTTHRALDENNKFSFLPELLDHIKQHQPIFCGVETGAKGKANSASNEMVFAKFKSLIFGFISSEIAASEYSNTISKNDIIFISGGIYGLMDNWWFESVVTQVDQLLEIIDEHVERVLVG